MWVMKWRLLAVMGIGVMMSSGCVLISHLERMVKNLDPVERLYDRHYVLRKKDAGLLEGPYTMSKVFAPNRISLGSGDHEIEVTIRGCQPTDDEKLDCEAQGFLVRVKWDGVYVRKDCRAALGENAFKAVIYTPANTVSVMDETGEVESEILTYRMPQLLSLMDGYCLLDHSDTNYPLYQVFLEAERLAKKHKKGYWATHTEPPAPATTNAVSNVATNK